MPKPKPKPKPKAKRKPTPPPPPPPKPKHKPAKKSQKAEPAMNSKHHVSHTEREVLDAPEQKPAPDPPQEATRGAGTGENAVLTRDRQYNETVPGAFPANISPSPEVQKEIRAAHAAEEGVPEPSKDVLQP
jgi:hypothetical protein